MALPTAPIVLTAPTEAVRAGSALHATRTTRSTIVDRARHDQRTWRSGLTAVAAAVAATRPQRSTASGRDYGERGAQRRLRGPRALQQAVDLLVKELEMDERAAMRIVKDIRTFVVAREGEDATGSRSMAWAKRLCRGLKMHEGLEPLLQKVGGVEQVLLDLEARSNKHGEVFRDITRQHQALRDGEAVDMEDYGKAAEYMAQEWWVRASAERIIDRIDQYFLLSGEQVRKGHPPWAYSNDKNSVPKGWKQYEVQGRRLFWNPETMRMQTKAPPGYDADEPPREPPAAREPPLKLLDIGSSVNRFQDWPFFVEAHALDLQPQAEEVLQADFFEVPILEEAQADASPFCVEDGELKGLVANAFDVVVISLVLSFLPSPEKRIEMVAKARRCLRNDRGLLFVVEGGSAVMDGSWYQKDAAAEWSLAMESAGFKAMHFDASLREGRRSKRVLQWILETKPVETTNLAPLYVTKELEW
ncbi:unnamed protein product [Durusdinium trenchii]|uniref:Methyltransferase BMT2 homolog n=1 Tax=Durusdinium trenchii TaxID=1381693 RepID=A0ABP0KC05_9DINO